MASLCREIAVKTFGDLRAYGIKPDGFAYVPQVCE